MAFTKFPEKLPLIQTLLLLVLYSHPGLALESDRSAPISIEADNVNLDQNQGLAVYTGNVHLQQGSIDIQADTITVHANNGQLDSAVIVGKESLARFQQSLENGQTMSGEAHYIEIQQGREEVIFKGEATVDDGYNKISGGVIHYNNIQQKVIAEKSEQNDGRVKMIFLPPGSDQPSQETP